MATRRYIDANVILRYLLKDVATQYKEAALWLEQSPPDSLVVSAVIVAEVTYIMRSVGYDRKQICFALEFILGLESVEGTGGGVLHRTLALYETQIALDYADCYLIARALTDKAEVATFDKKLLKIWAAERS